MKGDPCIFNEDRRCQAGRDTLCNKCIYGPNGTEFNTRNSSNSTKIKENE